METANDRLEYLEVLEKIKKDGVCPFCPEHLLKYHKKPILLDGEFWIVTENMYPYKNTLFHFLFIHKRHIETVLDLSKDSWSELHLLHKWLIKTRGILGGTIIFRFGNNDRTGSSVKHLHAQL